MEFDSEQRESRRVCLQEGNRNSTSTKEGTKGTGDAENSTSLCDLPPEVDMVNFIKCKGISDPRAFKVVLGTNQMVDETLAELQEAVSSSTFVPDPSDGVFASAAKAKVSLDLLSVTSCSLIGQDWEDLVK